MDRAQIYTISDDVDSVVASVVKKAVNDGCDDNTLIQAVLSCARAKRVVEKVVADLYKTLPAALL